MTEMEMLKSLFCKSEEELFSDLLVLLIGKYSSVTKKTGKYIYAKGDLPVMLVAHLDTVWDYGERQVFYDQKQEVMWSPQGLGADDRAGIFMIMRLLEIGYRPSLLFTCGEERGGIGARQFAMDYPELPNVSFIIELDRQGTRDAVYYDCANPLFEEFINSFGFETAWGIFSDISIICPAVGIAGVNLSIGYFNEHTSCEMLFIDVMYSTIWKVVNILDTENLEHFSKFEYIKRKDDDNGKGRTGKAESNQQIYRGLRRRVCGK